MDHAWLLILTVGKSVVDIKGILCRTVLKKCMNLKVSLSTITSDLLEVCGHVFLLLFFSIYSHFLCSGVKGV